MGETVLDAMRISGLQTQKSEQFKFVTAAYTAKIKQLKAALKGAPQGEYCEAESEMKLNQTDEIS